MKNIFFTHGSTDTPLFKAVRDYINRDAARFHMPGHKGKLVYPFEEAALYDVTEVLGTDSLYEASGAIAALEREYAGLYGTGTSILSAGGSTLCIQTMLSLCLRPGDSVICGRGAHVSAVNAIALLDLCPVWVYPEIQEESGLTGAVNPAEIEKALRRNHGVRAVYVTSPNYYGVLCDIAAISGICRAHGVPLLVDNAHGAHLKFLKESIHPMDLGADMSADSLHKTLPVLTGGAVLHIKNPGLTADAKRKMALFGSTSPSYPVMLSCDAALDYLKIGAADDLRRICADMEKIKRLAEGRGFSGPSGITDPMRLTVGFDKMGYTGREFGEYIRERGVEPEYMSERFCVFLAGPGNTEKDFHRLEKIISELPEKEPLIRAAAGFSRPVQTTGIREAAFAPCGTVPIQNAEGLIAASMVSPCPPGIPIVMPGEKIDEGIVSILKSYGILEINVIK